MEDAFFIRRDGSYPYELRYPPPDFGRKIGESIDGKLVGENHRFLQSGDGVPK